jgi:hypothetical protein
MTHNQFRDLCAPCVWHDTPNATWSIRWENRICVIKFSAVLMISFLRITMPCRLVHKQQDFGGDHCLHLQGKFSWTTLKRTQQALQKPITHNIHCVIFQKRLNFYSSPNIVWVVTHGLSWAWDRKKMHMTFGWRDIAGFCRSWTGLLRRKMI